MLERETEESLFFLTLKGRILGFSPGQRGGDPTQGHLPPSLIKKSPDYTKF